MKKVLVVTLAVLMMAFAFTAMAAQNQDSAATMGDGVSDFLATDKNFAGYGADSNYPDGIYLPYSVNNTDGTVSAGNIHSDYQRNTDACAACHATHTAVGEALLQWESVQDTCFACHDGTLAQTYNVKDGYISGTAGMRTMGGLFGTGTESSLSKHDVDSNDANGNPINLMAAPGADKNAVQPVDSKTGELLETGWYEVFECTSCHEPHGKADNYRILNPNVNGFANTKVLKEQMTTTDNLTYKAAKGAWLVGYPMGYKVYSSTDGITFTAVAGTSYIANLNAGTITFSTPQTAGIYLDYNPGLKVTGNVTAKLTQSEVAVYGAGMDTFCGACHTDYDTENDPGSATTLNGTYTEAYRHQVGNVYSSASTHAELTFGQATPGAANNVQTCLTCHVAHGVDLQWWTDWAVKTHYDDKGFTVSDEISGSSALKRLPNMSTCEACHAKGQANYAY